MPDDIGSLASPPFYSDTAGWKVTNVMYENTIALGPNYYLTASRDNLWCVTWLVKGTIVLDGIRMTGRDHSQTSHSGVLNKEMIKLVSVF